MSPSIPALAPMRVLACLMTPAAIRTPGKAGRLAVRKHDLTCHAFSVTPLQLDSLHPFDTRSAVPSLTILNAGPIAGQAWESGSEAAPAVDRVHAPGADNIGVKVTDTPGLFGVGIAIGFTPADIVWGAEQPVPSMIRGSDDRDRASP